jgi:hypothetical protein
MPHSLQKMEVLNKKDAMPKELKSDCERILKSRLNHGEKTCERIMRAITTNHHGRQRRQRGVWLCAVSATHELERDNKLTIGTCNEGEGSRMQKLPIEIQRPFRPRKSVASARSVSEAAMRKE